MKTRKLILAAIFALMMSTVCCADDRPIPTDKLPDAAKTFVKQIFPEAIISFAKIESDFPKEYEALLNNGVKVEFDSKGVWKSVDCNQGIVPASVIPAAIADYVKTAFPGVAISKIAKKRYGYEIELQNDIELRFNNAGGFIGYDD